MGIVGKLSSQAGDRTAKSNLAVAAQCLAKSELLAEIAGSLGGTEAALVGDCAEVLTEVAKQRPELVAPYAAKLVPLLVHKTTRIRWEAMHCMALTATGAAKIVAPLLPRLRETIASDTSVIVRDYAVDAVGAFAGTGKQASHEALPILKEALVAWNGKHAGHALDGIIQVARADTRHAKELHAIAKRYLDGATGVIRKSAKVLFKLTGEDMR
jgi:hypothetical protein